MAVRLAFAAKQRGVMLGRSGSKLVFRTPLVLTEDDTDQVLTVLGALLKEGV